MRQYQDPSACDCAEPRDNPLNVGTCLVCGKPIREGAP